MYVAGKRAVRNAGKESSIREQISQAVAALIADAKLDNSELKAGEEDDLVAAADSPCASRWARMRASRSSFGSLPCHSSLRSCFAKSRTALISSMSSLRCQGPYDMLRSFHFPLIGSFTFHRNSQDATSTPVISSQRLPPSPSLVLLPCLSAFLIRVRLSLCVAMVLSL
jgi:hypothetical protein